MRSSVKPYYSFFYYQNKRTKLLVGFFNGESGTLLNTDGKLNLNIDYI